MAKPLNKDNLSYLGLDFQYRLINQILTDRRFGESIIEIVNPQYFEDMHLKIIVATIKDAYSKYDNIPDIESLKIRLVDNVKDEIDRNVVISYIRRIKESEVNDTIFIQDTSVKFFKKQELKKAIKEITTVMEKGSIDDYDIAEDIIKKALEHGNKEDNIVDISDNIESVLEDDYRKPIPTGIEGLDKIMDGGLARGELAIILAAWGVGKTTFVTQIANHAKFAGHNVLQIFFEDNIKVIQRKHISCYTHVPLNDLKYHRNQVLETFKTFQESEGQLKLVKLKSTGVTVPTIKKMVKKKISEGFRPDLILLDYIDCLKPSKKSGDINEDQGSTMREFETMLEELNVAGWTCVQGNRCCSLDTNVNILRLGETEIKNVKEGDKILTHDGYKNINTVFPIQKQTVYKIKLKSGKEIKVSAKHDFPVKYGKLKSISTGLKVGDKLFIEKNK